MKSLQPINTVTDHCPAIAHVNSNSIQVPGTWIKLELRLGLELELGLGWDEMGWDGDLY